MDDSDTATLAAASSDSQSNSLGLNFDCPPISDASSLLISNPLKADSESSPVIAKQHHTLDGVTSNILKGDPTREAHKASDLEDKKPVMDYDRSKTGGPQREKLSSQELTARMDIIREKNEKIKHRRLAVEADENAFKASQEVERMKNAENRKVQESINRDREQNARRKMDKIGIRDWDSGKQSGGWKQRPKRDDTRRENASGPSGSEDMTVSEPTRTGTDNLRTERLRDRTKNGQMTRGREGIGRPGRSPAAAEGRDEVLVESDT